MTRKQDDDYDDTLSYPLLIVVITSIITGMVFQKLIDFFMVM